MGLKIPLVNSHQPPRAKLGFSLSLQLFFLERTEFATLRLRGRPGRDGFKVHCGPFLGVHIFNMAANLSPKMVPQCTLTIISTRSPAQPQNGEYDMHTNETFRTNEEQYGHYPIKERRFHCCSSSYGGIY